MAERIGGNGFQFCGHGRRWPRGAGDGESPKSREHTVSRIGIDHARQLRRLLGVGQKGQQFGAGFLDGDQLFELMRRDFDGGPIELIAFITDAMR